MKDEIKNYVLEVLKESDIEEVVALYELVKSCEGCVWDENYPSLTNVEEDVAQGDLFGIRNKEGKIIGVIAKDRDEVVDTLPCWNPSLQPGAEFARLAVHPAYQKRGIARILHRLLWGIMQKQGYKSVHFMVAASNTAAVRSYSALPYEKKGEVDMFGHHYICYEREV